MREFISSMIGEEKLVFNYKEYDTLFVEKEYHSYYLFFFLKNMQDLELVQKESEQILSAIKDNPNIYHPDMDKNITCIFFLCAEEEMYYELGENGKISPLSKAICLVEEDLNYFKKNVFVYTEKMDDFAKQNVGKFESLCREYFNGKNFEQYKMSAKVNFEYDFLINLFIKIPFLNFHAYQGEGDQTYCTMEKYIEDQCDEQQIDRKHIHDICDDLEPLLEDEERLYKWLDALVQNQANEEKELAEVTENED